MLFQFIAIRILQTNTRTFYTAFEKNEYGYANIGFPRHVLLVDDVCSVIHSGLG